MWALVHDTMAEQALQRAACTRASLAGAQDLQEQMLTSGAAPVPKYRSATKAPLLQKMADMLRNDNFFILYQHVGLLKLQDNFMTSSRKLSRTEHCNVQSCRRQRGAEVAESHLHLLWSR